MMFTDKIIAKTTIIATEDMFVKIMINNYRL